MSPFVRPGCAGQEGHHHPATSRARHPLMRASILLTALAAVSVVSATAAWACSCLRYESAAAQMAEADVVFVGRMTSFSNHAMGDNHPHAMHMARFEVSRTIKGEALPVRAVMHATDEAMCGIRFEMGRETIVLARVRDGVLTTSLCDAPQFPLADYVRAAGE